MMIELKQIVFQSNAFYSKNEHTTVHIKMILWKTTFR